MSENGGERGMQTDGDYGPLAVVCRHSVTHEPAIQIVQVVFEFIPSAGWRGPPVVLRGFCVYSGCPRGLKKS